MYLVGWHFLGWCFYVLLSSRADAFVCLCFSGQVFFYGVELSMYLSIFFLLALNLSLYFSYLSIILYLTLWILSQLDSIETSENAANPANFYNFDLSASRHCCVQFFCALSTQTSKPAAFPSVLSTISNTKLLRNLKNTWGTTQKNTVFGAIPISRTHEMSLLTFLLWQSLTSLLCNCLLQVFISRTFGFQTSFEKQTKQKNTWNS